MSYSITISGHKDAGSADESRAFEEDVAEAARIFVSELDGVTSATFSGGNIGTKDLREKQPA
jgi:hypothetical protein